MIILQDRDYDIIDTIGLLEIMSYKQIQKMFFPTRESCYTRFGKLLQEKLIEGIGYKGFKYFRLSKKGLEMYNNRYDLDKDQVEYKLIEHRELRTELYVELQKYDISDWKNEVDFNEIGRKFDATFEYNGKLYLVEIHNMQKTIKVKEKVVELCKVPPVFTLLIYARNVNPVRNMLEKLNEKGFDEVRRYQLRVDKFGKEIVL